MEDKEGQKSDGDPKKHMTKEDAARIQRAYAKEHDGKVDKGTFPARAQAAADRNENKSKEGGSGQTGEETKNTKWVRLKLYIAKKKYEYFRA